MTSPTFISSAPNILPGWKQAFPAADFYHGLPKTFDGFNDAPIFLDFMNLSSHEKQQWLQCCLETERKVIVVTLTPNLHEAIDVIKKGAVGYGHTLSTPELLREMAMVVNHGGVWIGNKLMKRVMAALNHVGRRGGASPKSALQRFQGLLSEREAAVCQLVASGATNAEISALLNIKERTVKAHVTAIFDKLEVRNRVELSLVLNNIPFSREGDARQ